MRGSLAGPQGFPLLCPIPHSPQFLLPPRRRKSRSLLSLDMLTRQRTEFYFQTKRNSCEIHIYQVGSQQNLSIRELPSFIDLDAFAGRESRSLRLTTSAHSAHSAPSTRPSIQLHQAAHPGRAPSIIQGAGSAKHAEQRRGAGSAPHCRDPPGAAPICMYELQMVSPADGTTALIYSSANV